MANDFKENLSRRIAALETKLYGHCEEVEKVMAGYNPSSFCAGFLYALTLVRGLITQIPDAVDAAPMVHGRWIVDESGVIICSECGAEHEWLDYRASFCEDCGAKMDLKEADHDPG